MLIVIDNISKNKTKQKKLINSRTKILLMDKKNQTGNY